MEVRKPISLAVSNRREKRGSKPVACFIRGAKLLKKERERDHLSLPPRRFPPNLLV